MWLTTVYFSLYLVIMYLFSWYNMIPLIAMVSTKEFKLMMYKKGAWFIMYSNVFSEIIVNWLPWVILVHSLLFKSLEFISSVMIELFFIELALIIYIFSSMVCSEIEMLVNYFNLNTSLFLLLVSLMLYVSLVSLVYFIMNYNMIQPFMVKHLLFTLWNYNSVFNSVLMATSMFSKMGIMVSFTFGSSLLFSCYLFFGYSEDYSLFIESFMITLLLFLVVQSSSFYSFNPFLLNSLFSVIGFIGFIISISAFGSSAAVLVVGNLIDVYVFGLIAVMINHTMFMFSYGVVVYSFMLYFFLVDVEVLLFLILLLDLSSLVVQSFTLTNRLSLNLIAGSIFSSLLSLALVTLMLLLTGIIGFNFMLGAIMSATIYIIINLISMLELMNLVIQLFIFTLLSQSLIQLALSGFNSSNSVLIKLCSIDVQIESMKGLFTVLLWLVDYVYVK